MGDYQYLSVDGTLTASKFGITDLDSQYLYTPPSMGARFPRPVHQWFGVMDYTIQNRAGGAAVVGFGVHLDPGRWRAGAWIQATTTYIDSTSNAQSGATVFAMESATAGDGHLIACYDPFNTIGYNISASSASGPNVGRVVEYSDSGGTWTQVVQPLVAPISGATTWATGERAVCWPMPSLGSWVPMTAAHGTGVPVGMYGIRVRATAAPSTTSVAASQIVIGRMYQLTENVADNAVVAPPMETEMVMAGSHLAVLISRDTGAANVANDTGSVAFCKVRLRG